MLMRASQIRFYRWLPNPASFLRENDQLTDNINRLTGHRFPPEFLSRDDNSCTVTTRETAMTRNFSNVLKICSKKENAGRCRHRSIEFFFSSFAFRAFLFDARGLINIFEKVRSLHGFRLDLSTDCLRKITFQQNKTWDFVWTEFYLFSTYHPEFETKFECSTERVDNNKRDYEIWTTGQKLIFIFL